MQHKIFCVREFIKTAVQRAFRLRFNIQPPTRNNICRWNHQYEQIGCLCQGKSSGRPRVSEENVRRIQESFERSPHKSTRRSEQRTWNTATNCLVCVEAPFTLQLSPYFLITVYLYNFCVDHSVYLFIYLWQCTSCDWVKYILLLYVRLVIIVVLLPDLLYSLVLITFIVGCLCNMSEKLPVILIFPLMMADGATACWILSINNLCVCTKCS